MDFINAMRGFNTAPAVRDDKGSISIGALMNPNVELFYKLMRDAPNIQQYLQRADLVALVALIFHARDAREGKGERKVFYQAMIWLHQVHPNLFRILITYLPEFGGYMDFVKIYNMVAPNSKNFKNKGIRKLLITEYASRLRAVQAEKDQNRISDLALMVKWAPRRTSRPNKRMAKQMEKCLFGEDPRKSEKYRKLIASKNQCVEVKLSTYEKLDTINPGSVPAKALVRYRKAFFAQNKTHTHLGRLDLAERFKKYMADKTTKVKATGLMPHELYLQMASQYQVDPTLEKSWDALVQDYSSTAIGDMLVMSDLSGSMHGIPMQVSKALGLLIASIAPAPFTNKMLIFADEATWVEFPPKSTFKQKVTILDRAYVGYSTNFYSALQSILSKAIQARVKRVPSKLLVLTDLQFDRWGTADWNSKAKKIQKLYTKAGYVMPTLVLWNLRGNTQDYPAQSNEENVIMLSGFSPNLLRLIQHGATPETTINEIIQNPRYAGVVNATKAYVAGYPLSLRNHGAKVRRRFKPIIVVEDEVESVAKFVQDMDISVALVAEKINNPASSSDDEDCMEWEYVTDDEFEIM